MATKKTNRKPLFGNLRSHSMHSTNHKQKLNTKKVKIDGETKIISMREARTLKKSNEKAA